MIATLLGEVSEKLADSVVIDVGGVGYGLYVTTEDLDRMALSQKTKVYVYEHIREQSHDLFGFLSRSTLGLFEQLIGVNGVGPKMGLSMLSVGTIDNVKQAIADGNLKYLQQANGVGRRVAERVVVDLKDKVGLVSVDLESTGMLVGESSLMQDEAAEALVALGYSPADALRALKDVDKTLPVGERVKQALGGGKK
jgi:Holliday junction DNA helicase RuvA